MALIRGQPCSNNLTASRANVADGINAIFGG
ncbi:hypothetical protein FHS77_002004 [Paenochrobactrum gallinarii]|uniref:Uncharacterized protein n=1 Tax=Paenochrobactrum gallinarii TaxID=643673 RepID=A0A841M0T6_9HYPH|nr:hypothetical protein [Paenochrobactrum gallinarii]